MSNHNKYKSDKYNVIRDFISDTIYIIEPFNNHVRFNRVWPHIIGSRTRIEFLIGNDKDPDGDFILEFIADCEIESDRLIVKRSDFGRIWETSIPISNIKLDPNFVQEN